MMISTNKILQGNVLTRLKELPDESIDCLVTSPPYYGLRSYGTDPQIWGGDENCNHEWTKTPPRRERKVTDIKDLNSKQYTNFGTVHELPEQDICIHCNAWKGELGLEPTFQLYLDHLWMIFDEVKRVLKKTGTCWVNLGDSYGGSGGSTGHTSDTKNLGRKTFDYGAYPTYANTSQYQPKSLLQIPSRFAIGMTDRGWILRNSIIWYKRSCMPSSAKDRFTVDYEMMYFFTKSTKYYFEQQREGENYYKTVAKKGSKRFGGNNAPGNPTIREDRVIETIGRNKRCVWDIVPKGFKEAHFAVFPPELAETPIKAGCPEGGIVLDPFFGSGTTGEVALKLDRKFLGIELKPEYIEIAERRLNKVGLFLESKAV